MNIAYNLSQLGDHAIPFVMCGSYLDSAYREHVQDSNIDSRGITSLDEWSQSSHGFIFTDNEQNQFTAFFSGPAETPDYEPRLDKFLNTVKDEIAFAILAPDLPRNMIAVASRLNDLSIPFLCDPGQQISDFSDTDCRELVEVSQLMIGNTYEIARLRSAVSNLDDCLEGLITTRGAKGAEWSVGDQTGLEPSATPAKLVDPTGCGDAFRAGVTHAHIHGASWKDAVRCGCTVASIKMAMPGSQSHDLSQFAQSFKRDWGYSPPWE